MSAARPGSGSTISDLLAALGRSAPWEKAAGWDPVGLQLGDPLAAVRTVAVCHEATESVVAELQSRPVDLLLSYHPLLFRPTTAWLAGATPAGRALRLARAGIAVAAVHTNFDVAPGGAADALAEALGLDELEGFGPVFGPEMSKLVAFVPADAADALLDAVVAAGAGRIGSYTHCSYRSEGTGTFYAGEGTRPTAGRAGALNREPEQRLEFLAPRSRVDDVVRALVAAHPYEEPAYDVYEQRGNAGMVGRVGRPGEGTRLEELAERVQRALGAGVLRIAGEPGRILDRVAVVPGSGADLIPQALAAGADALVTGDLGHHRARAALDAGLCLLDPGHAPTERPGLERLFATVAAQGLEARSLLGFDPDPWRAV